MNINPVELENIKLEDTVLSSYPELGGSALNALYMREIYTVGDLIQRTPLELANISGLGETSRKQIYKLANRLGWPCSALAKVYFVPLMNQTDEIPRHYRRCRPFPLKPLTQEHFDIREKWRNNRSKNTWKVQLFKLERWVKCCIEPKGLPLRTLSVDI